MMPEKRPHVLAGAAAENNVDFSLLGDLQCGVGVDSDVVTVGHAKLESDVRCAPPILEVRTLGRTVQSQVIELWNAVEVSK